ncbi:MAG: hypothetical protein ABI444_13675 [Candidatus Kapaibacterium sp.]|jgi:hypothetical protein
MSTEEQNASMAQQNTDAGTEHSEPLSEDTPEQPDNLANAVSANADSTSADVHSEVSDEAKPHQDGPKQDKPKVDRPKGERRNQTAPKKTNRRDSNPLAFKRSAAPAREPKRTKRYVSIAWSGQREPLDNLIWCEAERDGAWLVITALEQVKTRREILERLTALDEGIVGLDFSFSYPGPFLDFLKTTKIAEDWRGLLKQVREDLKKNVDDGVRHWIEHIGKYREANLDPNPPPVFDNRRGRDFRDRDSRDRDFRGRPAPAKPLEPHEQPSIAERFRRTEQVIRKAAEPHVTSALAINYNKLTSRYEFNSVSPRGRNTLLGMSMLHQLLEARPDITVWPFQQPGKLTLVEVEPWMFTKGKLRDASAMRDLLAREEDEGMEISHAFRELATRNVDAQRAFVSMLGMILSETRQDRAVRPLRDYQKSFYADVRVGTEGWFYGVGYRNLEAEQQARDEKQSRAKPAKRERPKREPRNPKPPREQESERVNDSKVIDSKGSDSNVDVPIVTASEPVDVANVVTENVATANSETQSAPVIDANSEN